MAQMKAVLVGVDEYARPDIPPLRGCVNDVLLVRSVLKGYFGLENEDIHVVLNSRATRAGILSRLERTVDGAAPGDLLVFYFSGHGSQIRDRDGDELTDFLDELICPYDMDWDARRYILDDDLERVFGALPDGVVVEAFFDCCFWGASPRAFDAYAQTSVLRPDVRYLPPPLDVAARYEGDEDRIGVHRLESCSCFSDQNVLWGASEEGHSAAEDIFDGQVQGVFTYYGWRSIERRFEQILAREYTRDQLLGELRASLRTRGYVQVPELSAPDDLRTLGPFLRRGWRERAGRVG